MFFTGAAKAGAEAAASRQSAAAACAAVDRNVGKRMVNPCIKNVRIIE
jgi:hypothetical protein